MNNGALDKEVKRLVHLNSSEKGIVRPVDILVQLGYLSKKDFENWRLGRIDYLEKMVSINLSKLTLINKSIRKHAKDLGLKESWTAYHKHGKGKKQRLRFSKSGKQVIENTYATHYLDSDRMNELKTKSAGVQ